MIQVDREITHGCVMPVNVCNGYCWYDLQGEVLGQPNLNINSTAKCCKVTSVTETKYHWCAGKRSISHHSMVFFSSRIKGSTDSNLFLPNISIYTNIGNIL